MRLFLNFFCFFKCTSEQHTYTSSEYLHLEEEETMLARDTENFKIFVPGARIELATIRIPT